MYKNELKAIRHANLFRKREIYDDDLIDLASNDYLGFSQDKKLFKKAYKRVLNYPTLSPKASMLINGYHQIHKEFEESLSFANQFEQAIVVGSGFLANLALIDTLARRGDLLILDEYYHASGVFASKNSLAKVKFFKHNDPDDLRAILKNSSYKRAIVAVEGVYSMEADILNREIFAVVDEFGALLIVDEAHSSGVIGKNLLGVFDHYSITPTQNHIKMGTLGKAYGSYGAYILASNHVVEFLQNRAKSIIYATAPSVFDIALGLEAFKKIIKKRDILSKKIKNRIKLVDDILDTSIDSLILKLEVASSNEALRIKELFLKKGFLIAAIRAPTVKKPILRIILRTNIKREILKNFLQEIKLEI